MSDNTLRPDWRTPLPGRIRANDSTRCELLRRHDEAIDSSMSTYADPTSGFRVFTAEFLAYRGYCCNSGCRHCPFAPDE